MRAFACLFLCLIVSLPAFAKKQSREEVLALHGIDGKTELTFVDEITIEGHVFSHTDPNENGGFLISVSNVDRLRHVNKHMNDVRQYTDKISCDRYIATKQAERDYRIEAVMAIGTNLTHRPVFLKQEKTVYLLCMCYVKRVKSPGQE